MMREEIGGKYWGIDFGFFNREWDGKRVCMSIKQGFSTREEAEKWAAENDITDGEIYSYTRIF